MQYKITGLLVYPDDSCRRIEMYTTAKSRQKAVSNVKYRCGLHNLLRDVKAEEVHEPRQMKQMTLF